MNEGISIKRSKAKFEMQNQIYLAHSFNPKDRDVVELFKGICQGAGFHYVNVDQGSPKTPPEEARKLISESQALVAIGTRLEEVRPGVYSMSKAVEQEIIMAYTFDKPVIIFVEKGVDVATGFTPNLSTYHEFDRSSLRSPKSLPKFLAKAISTITNLKSYTTLPANRRIMPRDYFAENSQSLIELIDQSGTFKWRYQLTRRLRFRAQFSGTLKAGAWAFVPFNKDVPNDHIRWSYRIDYKTKPFKFKPIIEKRTKDVIDIHLQIDPQPEAGDVIEYTTFFESPYLNPIYSEDVQENHPPIIIDGVEYVCYDGQMPVIEMNNMEIILRFPTSYDMEPKNVMPFVASHTQKFNYLIENEMKRMITDDESFGGSVSIKISVQNPWLNHLYGFAWNPHKKPC